MPRLRISISDYHAIDKADIQIDGITVLTGPNGSGKSTLTRNLFYYLYTSRHFAFYSNNNWISELRARVEMMTSRADISLLRHKNLYDARQEVLRSLRVCSRNGDAQEAFEIFNKYLDKLEQANLEIRDRNRQERMLLSRAYAEIYDRLIENGTLSADMTWEEKTSGLFRALRNQIEQEYDKLCRDVNNMSPASLNRKVREIFEDTSGIAPSFKIEENGIPLADKDHCRPSEWFDHVFYVDSPMAATNRTDEPIWDIFQDALLAKRAREVNGAKVISRIIGNTAGGNAEVAEDSLGLNDELYFRPRKGERFKLTDAATGLKTLAYLQRLVDNGLLGPHTLLMIDEPEAHLHPQWVFEVARILVLIHKRLGTSIMIASHDPDMVEAVSVIGTKENVVPRFYFSEKSPTASRYSFHDCGSEIAPIFSSFNVALRKIEEYGNG